MSDANFAGVCGSGRRRKHCGKGKVCLRGKCVKPRRGKGRFLTRWCKNGPVIQAGPRRGQCPNKRQAAARAKRIGRKSPARRAAPARSSSGTHDYWPTRPLSGVGRARRRRY